MSHMNQEEKRFTELASQHHGQRALLSSSWGETAVREAATRCVGRERLLREQLRSLVRHARALADVITDITSDKVVVSAEKLAATAISITRLVAEIRGIRHELATLSTVITHDEPTRRRSTL